MGANKTVLLPKQERILDQVGENIRYARLRRDLSTTQVSERAGIGRTTLTKIEKGDPGVSLGAYLKVLVVLQLEKDLLKIASDDAFGRLLQDSKLPHRERASRK